MVFFSQLGLLLWKNLLLQKHKPCVTVFEVLLPVFFALLCLFIHFQNQPNEYKQRWRAKEHKEDSYYPFKVAYRYSVDQMGYAPKTPLTSRVMERIQTNLIEKSDYNYRHRYLNTSEFLQGFDTEDELVRYQRNATHNFISFVSVVFRGLQEGVTVLPLTTTFYIRPMSSWKAEWKTSRHFPTRRFSGPSHTEVMSAMSLVAEALMEEWTNRSDLPDLGLSMMFMPEERPHLTSTWRIVSNFLPIFLVFSFILSVIQITKSVVFEKERKLKESMKLMGLKPAAHWASWFITCYVYLAVAMAIYAFIFGLSIASSGPILPYTDALLFYVFLLCYGAAIVSFCFFISSIVQRANVGAVVSGVLFTVLYVPNFFLSNKYEDMTRSQKLSSCLMFNQAIFLGCEVIKQYEFYKEGVQWSNIHLPVTIDENLSFLDVLVMLLVDTAIHLVLAWYIDNIRPGEFGVPKPYYFCFMKRYWCGTSGSADKKVGDGETMEDEIHFECDPAGLKEGIRICSLSKTFGKNKMAVNNLSLKMYEGQITALLGHNGAGKTTTMSMLTGFFPPTSGTAYVNEKDISTDIDGVRESLGLCPQHNILFDTLTVNEHLTFFAKLKGCPGNRVQEEVDTMIREFGLEAKRNAQARTLSGGLKRKLSVAIALINGSKVVILDEPTSGMDPAARRKTWEVLQRHQAGRTILLTTHFMDEADVLGERIAIMAEGVVKCCGSSLFLKKLYGAGYHLVIVKTVACNAADVTQLIQTSVPSAQLERELNAELTYLLPDDQSATFPEMMRNLENQKERLGIDSFGATATTMEEVFLKVGECASREFDELSGIHKRHFDEEQAQDEVNNTEEQSKMLSTPTASVTAVNVSVLAFSQGFTKLTGMDLHLSQLCGMLVKKGIMLWRQRLMTVFQLLMPILFIALGCTVDMLTYSPSRTDDTAEAEVVSSLLFDLKGFDKVTIPYAAQSPNAMSLANVYLSQFDNQYTTVDLNLPQPGPMNTTLERMKNDMGYGTFRREFIFGAEFISVSNDSIEAKSWTSKLPFHASPIALTYMLNAVAKHLTNSSVDMKIGIHPYLADQSNFYHSSARHSYSKGVAVGFVLGMLIAIAMMFLGPSFIYFLIKEKTVGAKHLQVVSGASPTVFWVSTFIVDYLTYLVMSLLIMVVFASFGTEPFFDGNQLGLVLLVLITYGWAILPFIYLVHFLFTSPPTGMAICIIFNLFTGLKTFVTVYVMSEIREVEELSRKLDWIFLVFFPNHCVGRSFMMIYLNYRAYQSCNAEVDLEAECARRQDACCNNYGLGCPEDDCFWRDNLHWELPGIGRYILLMFLQGIVFFALTLVLEYRLPHRLWFYLFRRDRSAESVQDLGTTEDSDVAAERHRINALPDSALSQDGDSLLLVNLYRCYGSLVAVDHTCVGVPEQECFGLLGQNGAGKTTTFKMLTGDEMVSGGNAYLKGFDIKHNIKRVQRSIGYCPQFDALLEQMTGRETLTMYARLRGVPQSSIKNCVDLLMDVVLLTEHADKLTSDYSGGNKRKLSTAIAVIGDPPFILLDEPSTGMDPRARRQLWNLLSEIRASGRTLILTSHSMEECEALCTKIAIMVNGRFVCLGSTQHLKSKFGQGYTLEVKLDSQEDGTPTPYQPLLNYIQSCFPSAHLFDSHHGYVHIQVPDAEVQLADLFEAMEHSKGGLHVQDYHVHQTTLEQVFLAFTRNQIPQITTSKSCCPCFRKKGQEGHVIDTAILLNETNKASHC